MQTNYKEKILDKFCSDVFPAFMEFEEQRKKTLIKMILVEAILVLIPTLFFINIHVIENFNGEQLPIVICAIIFIEIIVALVYPNWVCSDFQNKLKEMKEKLNAKKIDKLNKRKEEIEKEIERRSMGGRR